MRLGKRLACLAMGAALCVGPLAVRAQVLAERVPADALVYVGWRGTSDLGPNYAKSNLKGLLDHTNLREQVATLIARGMEDAAKGDAKKAQDAKQAKVLIDALCKYPSAFYFGGLDLTDATQPQPKIAIVSEAGGEAQA